MYVCNCIVLDLNLEKIWRGLILGAGGEVGGLLVRCIFCLQADGSIAGMAHKMWGA